MLRPVIFIGCGGSGQKAVRYVRDAVERQLRYASWNEPLPKGWVFLGLDTLNQQEDPEEIPLLPASDFHSLSPQFNKYQPLEQAVLAQHQPGETSTYEDLIGWRPRSSEVKVPLKAGAGASRAVGRFAGIHSLKHVLVGPISQAFEAADQASADLAAVSEKLEVPTAPGGATPTPLVVVCASMAGGTGAGVALDVVEIVRNHHENGQFPLLVLFTPDIFDDAKYENQRRSMAGNALGLMCETMNAYWESAREPLPLWAGSRPEPGRGPHAVFAVGRRSLDGGDLGDATAVYKAVGQAMANWVTNHSVQERINNFMTANWVDKSHGNLGGYPFDKEQQTGMVSSFGAATLSVGRDRFERWANDLLARKVLDALVHGHRRGEHAPPGNGAPNESKRVSHLAGLASRHIALGDTGTSIQQPPMTSTQHRGAQTARRVFASEEAVKEERRHVEAALLEEFGGDLEGSARDWRGWLQRAAREQQGDSGQRALVFDQAHWGTEMVSATCMAVSAVVAQTSLLVAQQAVVDAIELLEGELGVLRTDASNEQRKADEDLKQAVAQPADALGSMRGDERPVRETIDLYAKGIARRWYAVRLEMAADALASTVHRVLHPIADVLRQAVGNAHVAIELPEWEAWPADEGSVPPAYQPSSVELTLESHTKWRGLLTSLCNEARSGRTEALPPVDAARFVLIAGEDDHVPSILRTKDDAGFRWSPTDGTAVAFVCDADIGNIKERVRQWTGRPGSSFRHTVNEGIGAYLAERDPISESVREDHAERLAQFRTALENAQRQSAPLARIDAGVHSEIYPGVPPSGNPELICAPFPLAPGDPAHDIAKQIVGEDNFDVANDDPPSVLISSFLATPVHPMAVASLTEPISKAVLDLNGNAAQVQAAFWLWRRTHRLDNFVPLPKATLQSMIRGFATARLCGFITTATDRPVRISGAGGPVEFPYPLLTRVKPADVLAALLESVALCYAWVSRDRLQAFEPYRRLHELGTSPDSTHAALEEWLRDGEARYEQVDEARASGGSKDERIAAAKGYMDANIDRLNKIKQWPLNGADDETSPRDGRIDSDILTREIVSVSLQCYEQVLKALERVEEAQIV